MESFLFARADNAILEATSNEELDTARAEEKDKGSDKKKTCDVLK